MVRNGRTNLQNDAGGGWSRVGGGRGGRWDGMRADLDSKGFARMSIEYSVFGVTGVMAVDCQTTLLNYSREHMGQVGGK